MLQPERDSTAITPLRKLASSPWETEGKSTRAKMKGRLRQCMSGLAGSGAGPELRTGLSYSAEAAGCNRRVIDSLRRGRMTAGGISGDSTRREGKTWSGGTNQRPSAAVYIDEVVAGRRPSTALGPSSPGPFAWSRHSPHCSRVPCAPGLIRLPPHTTITKGQGCLASLSRITPKALCSFLPDQSLRVSARTGAGSAPGPPRAWTAAESTQRPGVRSNATNARAAWRAKRLDTGGGLKRRRQDVRTLYRFGARKVMRAGQPGGPAAFQP